MVLLWPASRTVLSVDSAVAECSHEYRRRQAKSLGLGDGASLSTAAQLKDVEQPFRSTRRDGTGLGLKIVRRIIASHHGQMEMLNSPGVGTTVKVRLPSG